MGAAILAGLAVGYWKNLEEINTIWESDKHFSPTEERTLIDEGIKGWHRAVDALKYWSKES
jgi:glycerol kinase